MGYRRFTDQAGNEWEVRDLTRSEWELQPVSGSGERPRRIPAPGYESDPFELSEEELQKLLGEGGDSGRSRPARSPFRD